jgi:FkbM family methyltransferase
MKSLVKLLVRGIARFVCRSFKWGIVGNYFWEYLLENIRSQYKIVSFRGFKFKFSTPNYLALYRAETFSTKEPETLEWIDGMSSESVVWDIGANVGLYSIYAAKTRGCRVFAFEPSIFNLELLARNIDLNCLAEKVTIVPLPLSEQLSFSTLRMTSKTWGGALSTFGESFGHDGEDIKKVFEFPTIGLSMVDAVELLKIPQPDYIKMDVDGIEHLILKGGMPILEAARGVLVEINDHFTVQAQQTEKLMLEAGFKFKEKRHADYFDEVDDDASHTYNQFWVK